MLDQMFWRACIWMLESVYVCTCVLSSRWTFYMYVYLYGATSENKYYKNSITSDPVDDPYWSSRFLHLISLRIRSHL